MFILLRAIFLKVAFFLFFRFFSVIVEASRADFFATSKLVSAKKVVVHQNV